MSEQRAIEGAPEAVAPELGAVPAFGTGGSRRFVVLFVVYTMVPLIAYQYLLSSAAMDWYLFQVARQTAWVLGKIGYSSQVENPGAFVGREAEVRNALAGAAPGTASPAGAPPLSAWEVWRYRVLRAEQGVAQARGELKTLEELPALEGESDPAVTAKLWERVVLLGSLLQPDLARPYPAMLAAAPGIQEALTTVRGRVEALKTSPPADQNQRALAVREAIAAIEDFRAAEMNYLRDAVKKANVQLQGDRAPLVVFVYEPGTAARLAAARQELERLKSSPPSSAQLTAVGGLETKVAKLSEAVQDVQKTKPPIQFRFRVAAECSAIPSIIIYLGAILAFPTGWWIRMAGAVGGLPILYLVNILRLACLGTIGAFTEGGRWFKFSHEYIWQGIYIVFVVAVWMAWVEYLVRRRAAT